MDNFGDKKINIFGFKFKLKNFILTITVALAVLLVLLLVDMFVTDVSWYGVIIGTGFLVALVMACQLCGERGLNSDFPYDLILWVFPLSLIGARTYYVLCSLDEFSSFWEMCAIWNGGMAIYGGIIGGLIGLVICCLIKKCTDLRLQTRLGSGSQFACISLKTEWIVGTLRHSSMRVS